MSISSAMQTGVSGLQANSIAVGDISENIANANTVGYKRGFAQMVTTATGGGSNNGVLSVSAEHQSDIGRAGGLIQSNSATDLAIGGNGFFVVSVNPNETVQTNYHLTRAGSFLPDEDGYLRNAAGFYLAGFPYDASGQLGTVDRSSFGSMQTVNVGNVNLSADQTTEMSISGNLPAQSTGLATPGAPFVTSSEFFTGLGVSQRVSFSWQPTSTENQWTVTMRDHNGVDLGSVDVTFNDTGSQAGSPASYSNVTSLATAPSAFSFDTATGRATLTVDNGTAPQTMTVDLGQPGSFSGVTQFAGDFSQSFERDGSSVGELIRTEIDEDGTLYGVFDNGMRQPLFEIPVATVDNPNGLIEEKGNAYSLSGEAGAFQALTANSGSTGSITANALEGSNVDIATEMTDLIRVQRAFSTNARVITTVDDMLDETTRLKR